MSLKQRARLILIGTAAAAFLVSGMLEPQAPARLGRFLSRRGPAGQGPGPRPGRPEHIQGDVDRGVPATLGAHEYFEGRRWDGDFAVTERVSDIVARHSARAVRVRPLRMAGNDFEREHESRPTVLQYNPESVATATWPPASYLSALAPSPSLSITALSPQTVASTFTASHASLSGSVPPDVVGAVGPTQVMVPSNGIFRVFSKAGVLGSLSVSDDAFFASVLPAGTSPCDPRVTYDRLSGRWFITEITCGGVTGANHILIAVSSGSTITNTSSFSFYRFQQDLVGTTPNVDTGGFADYETLGVDANALYIGANMFSAAGSFYGTSGWVVNKANLLAGTLTVTAFRSLAACPSSCTAGPYTPQGVDNDDPNATIGYFIGVDVVNYGKLQLRRITNPGGTPSISGNVSLTTPTTNDPANQAAKGSLVPLDSVDYRLMQAQIKKSDVGGCSCLWTAQSIQVNASGVASTATGARNGVRWYQIDNLATTPTLVQSGTLFDSAATNPLGYWMGSVAANGQGHMALVASVAGVNSYPSVAVAGRLASDTLGATQAPSLAISGAGPYNDWETGVTSQRWGDYSKVVVDPTDDQTLWAFSDFAYSTSKTDAWGVGVVKLLAPPPATPISVSPSSIYPGVASTTITITGSAASGQGFFDPGTGFSNRLGVSISGGVTVNSLTFVNATTITANVSTVGASSASQSITVTNPDGQQATGTGLLLVSRPLVTSVSLTPSLASPQQARTTITWTATPTGGVTPYQYKWWLYNGTTWTMAGDWSTTNTLTWTPAASGSYLVGVWVRGAGNSADAAEVAYSVPYVVTANAAPVVSGVTLTPDRASPQPVSTTITWTAAPTGGTTPYQYKWSVYDGVSWTAVTGWTTTATYAWTPGTAGTGYRVMVWVRSAGNTVDAAEASQTSAYVIVAASRVASVSLTPDKASPQAPGTVITWTATPTGGVAPQQYKWWLYNGSTWTAVTGWTTTNTFVWTPTVAGTGYLVGVWVRSAGNTVDAGEVTYSVPYVIAGGAAGVSSVGLVSDKTAPQVPGTAITWTAAPSGGTAPYQYKWWVYDGTTWTATTGWVTSASYLWTPSTANSAYQVRVWVRSNGNAVDAAEASAAVAFAIAGTASRVVSVALSPDKASPQAANTTITWTATPSGGVAPLQYKWWIYDGVSWTNPGGWTTTNTLVWTPTVVGSNYLVGVWVKSAGNTADAGEVAYSVAYVVGSAASGVSSVALGADRTAPQLPGTTINWTATPTGGTSPYQYKWWVYDGTTWTATTGWVTANTYAWTPATANAAYQVRVWVRSNGNAADAAEASNAAAFAISSTTSRVTSVGLTPDKASPQAPGTTITWTATPSGGVTPYQYKWWIYDGVSWTNPGGWTTTNTLVWTPTVVGSSYLVGVWVKSAGNTADAGEVAYSVAYTVGGAAAGVSSVSLGADKTAPQAPGTTVTWTATPTGGISPYQYKWWTYDGTTWTAASGWVTGNTFAWTPVSANAAYQVRVWVRSSGNVVDAAEASASVAFAISGGTSRVTSVSLSPDKASPQAPGTTITWTATPSGGVTPYQYKWWVYNGSTWTAMTGWTSSNTLVWTPTLANAGYYVGVWVKSAGNTADAAEVPFSVTYVIR